MIHREGNHFDRPPSRRVVLVTGATGFVGSALVPALQERGRLVRPLARDTDCSPANVRGSTFGSARLASEPLRDVDCVVHLAARVHVMRESERDPVTAFRRVNVDWTRALAGAAAEAGVRRFIFVSSVKVNGEFTAPDLPFTADDVPAPVGPYAVSKREAELTLLDLSRESSMETVIIRPPLVYGPGVKGNFQAMMRWLLAGVPLPLAGVHNRMTLLGVDNLVSLIDACIEHPRAAGRVFLAGDDEDLSTPDLLRRMAAALGIPARLFTVPNPLLRGVASLLGRSSTVRRLSEDLRVDTSSTRELLGWRPAISVDEGLLRAASFFLEHKAGRHGK